MKRAATVIACLAILASLSVGSVAGASRSPQPSTSVAADVDGRPISIALIPTYFCHDFDYPKIHCFGSPKGLEAAKAARSQTLAAPAQNFGAGDYVTIFDGPNYSGGFMDVSQNYDALWSIGWNDRISSYKGRNSASGIFWTDWFASGNGKTFCCNANVATLSATYENAFSSMYRQ